MKKILFLTGLFIASYATISKSYACDEREKDSWFAIHQYGIKHVLPVLNEKRLAFDAFLNETERNDLADIRSQMRQLKKKFHHAKNENQEIGPERNVTMLSDESKKERRLQKKELMKRIHTIAESHEVELNLVFDQLKPQLQQWLDDISKLLPQKNLSDVFTVEMLASKRGPWKMLSRVGFLLLDPSKTISTDNRNKIAASDILPVSLEESINMFPNPAINSVTLDLTNVPADNKLIITDMEGKIILEKENLIATESIDCSGFPVGIYFVQLRSGNEVVNRKLVVSR